MIGSYLLWCDVETTGFDQAKCLLLEAAFSVTDRDLVELARLNLVIGHDLEKLADPARWHPNARRFHGANGLIEEVGQSDLDLAGADEKASQWLAEFTPVLEVDPIERLHGYPLAGTGIDFERRWLPAHLPKSYAMINRRSFDVNTLLTFFDAKELYAEKSEGDGKKQHRAMIDVHRDQEFTRKLARQAGVLLSSA